MVGASEEIGAYLEAGEEAPAWAAGWERYSSTHPASRDRQEAMQSQVSGLLAFRAAVGCPPLPGLKLKQAEKWRLEKC